MFRKLHNYGGNTLLSTRSPSIGFINKKKKKTKMLDNVVEVRETFYEKA